jgi:translation initiation factor IF-2
MERKPNFVLRGVKYFNKLSNNEKIYLLDIIYQYIDDLETQRKRKFGRRQKERIFFAILGIIKTYGNYDERYHSNLIPVKLNF